MCVCRHLRIHRKVYVYIYAYILHSSVFVSVYTHPKQKYVSIYIPVNKKHRSSVIAHINIHHILYTDIRLREKEDMTLT